MSVSSLDNDYYQRHLKCSWLDGEVYKHDSSCPDSKEVTSPEIRVTEFTGPLHFHIDKRTHRLRIMNETESSVDIVIEQKDN